MRIPIPFGNYSKRQLLRLTNLVNLFWNNDIKIQYCIEGGYLVILLETNNKNYWAELRPLVELFIEGEDFNKPIIEQSFNSFIPETQIRLVTGNFYFAILEVEQIIKRLIKIINDLEPSARVGFIFEEDIVKDEI